MKIALVDVDGRNFPNLALMKLSAWHKANGDIDPETWITENAKDDNDVTAAALRLWFKVKGIEVK